MKIGICGSVESNDCLITVKESSKLVITIDSIVEQYFGEKIIQTIKSTLKELQIEKINVSCVDKGALDYTIKARLKTAIERMNNIDA